MASDKRLASGHRVVVLPEEEQEKYKKAYPNFGRKICLMEPGSWITSQSYLQFADDIYNFKFEQDDVMIMSFPKSGTMWVSEIVWAMRNYSKINTEESKQPLMMRVPPYTHDFVWKTETKAMGEMIEKIYGSVDYNRGMMLQLAERLLKPRTIRSHHALSFLPPNMLDTCKVVFIARNPKDVCISLYHFIQLIDTFYFDGSVDDFAEFFMKSKCFYTPFWGYTKEVWEKRNHPNAHWIFFEDLKKDTRKEVHRLNQFLETNLTDQQLEQILEWTSFSNMKKRDPVLSNFTKDGVNVFTKSRNSSDFFRKGETGGWRNVFSAERIKQLDAWIEENTKDIDIKFTY